jgi:hypothetical protein
MMTVVPPCMHSKIWMADESSRDTCESQPAVSSRCDNHPAKSDTDPDSDLVRSNL